MSHRNSALFVAIAACAALHLGCGQLPDLFQVTVNGEAVGSQSTGGEQAKATATEATENAAEAAPADTDGGKAATEVAASTPPEPKFSDGVEGEIQRELHGFAEFSAMATNPELTLDDAFAPERVAAAVAEAPRDAWVVWDGPYESVAVKHPFAVTLDYHPAPHRERRDDTTEGERSQAHVFFRNSEGFLGVTQDAVLPVNTPLLVWGEVNPRRAPGQLVLVSADGSVFEARIYGDRHAKRWVNGLSRLGDREAVVPESPVNTALLEAEIKKLEIDGVLAEGSVHAVREALSPMGACAQRIWDKAAPKFDAIDARPIPYNTRQAKMDKLERKIIKSLPKRCRAEVSAAQAAVDDVFEPWIDARRKVLEASRAALSR